MNFTPSNTTVGYFSMEIALASAIPTYSGGLGVLAGDTLRGAADLGLSMCAVTLLHRTGYFRPAIDASGRQQEDPFGWNPSPHLTRTDAHASIAIEGREVRLRAWRYDVKGQSGALIPVFLLDADVEG